MNTVRSARAFAFATIFILCSSHLGPTPAYADNTTAVASPAADAVAASPAAAEVADSTAAAADAGAASLASADATDSTATAASLAAANSTATDSSAAAASSDAVTESATAESTKVSDSANASITSADSVNISVSTTASESVSPSNEASSNKANDANSVTESLRSASVSDALTARVSAAADTASTTAAQAADVVATTVISTGNPESDISTSGRRKNDGSSDIESVAVVTEGASAVTRSVAVTSASISAVEAVATSTSEVDRASVRKTLPPVPILEDVTVSPISQRSTVSAGLPTVLPNRGVGSLFPYNLVQSGLPFDPDSQSRRAFNQMANKINSAVALSLDGFSNTHIVPTPSRYNYPTVNYPNHYMLPSYSPYAYTLYNYFNYLNPSMSSMYSYPPYYQPGYTYPTASPTRMTNDPDPLHSSPFHMRTGTGDMHPVINSYGGSHVYDTRRSFNSPHPELQHQIYLAAPRAAPEHRMILPEIGGQNSRFRHDASKLFTQMRFDNGRVARSDNPRNYNIAYMDRKSRSPTIRSASANIDDKLVERIFRRREK